MNDVAPRRYVCLNPKCRRIFATWQVQCPSCHKWEIGMVGEEPSVLLPPPPPIPPLPPQGPRLVPDIEPELAESDGDDDGDSDSVPVLLTEISDTPVERDATGLGPFDDVLGGGLAVGSIVVLSGEPGCGKTSVILQAIDGVGLRCLYATSEQKTVEVAQHARRMGVGCKRVYIMASDELEVVIGCARKVKTQILVIDSINKLMCADVRSLAGSPTQVRECATRLRKFAKEEGITLIMVGHVTNDGQLAGPRTLSHDVDVVLELEVGNGNERILRAPKNRKGPTDVVGRFMMTATGLVPAPRKEEDEDDGTSGGVH
jgi:DNA repair protein RadA/Sms